MKFVCSMLMVFMLAGASWHRNGAWQTLLSLWQDAAAKSPQKSRPHNNLGNCYMLLGRHFEAIEEYRKAIALDRENIESYYNLANNLEAVGLASQAMPYYDHFCKTAAQSYGEQRRNACERVQRYLREAKEERRGK